MELESLWTSGRRLPAKVGWKRTTSPLDTRTKWTRKTRRHKRNKVERAGHTSKFWKKAHAQTRTEANDKMDRHQPKLEEGELSALSNTKPTSGAHQQFRDEGRAELSRAEQRTAEEELGKTEQTTHANSGRRRGKRKQRQSTQSRQGFRRVE